jgi:hypothetical protein
MYLVEFLGRADLLIACTEDGIKREKCMPRVGFEHTVPALVIKSTNELYCRVILTGRSRWPGGRRPGFAAASLVGLRVLIPPGARMFVSCVCLRVRRADHSFRGGVACLSCVTSSLDNEEASAHDRMNSLHAAVLFHCMSDRIC